MKPRTMDIETGERRTSARGSSSADDIDDIHVVKSSNLTSEAPLWMETDPNGSIHALASETAGLLGLSTRGARARDIRLFFPAAYVPISVMMRDAQHRLVEGEYSLHPRNRKPVRVHLRISPACEAPSPLLQWDVEVL